MGNDIRIMGIDPGLDATGFGVIATHGGEFTVVATGLIETHRSQVLPKRLAAIYDDMVTVVARYRPNHLVLEELFTNYQLPKTAILMAHARGVVCLAANQAGLEVTGYAPARIKKAVTGRGNATKSQMQQMIQMRLQLDELPNHHVADALAAAMTFHMMSAVDARLNTSSHTVQGIIPAEQVQ